MCLVTVLESCARVLFNALAALSSSRTASVLATRSPSSRSEDDLTQASRSSSSPISVASRRLTRCTKKFLLSSRRIKLKTLVAFSKFSTSVLTSMIFAHTVFQCPTLRTFSSRSIKNLRQIFSVTFRISLLARV